MGFRQWNEDDILPFFEMCSDPRVMEYFPNILSFSETKGMIYRVIDSIEQYGCGFYAVDLLQEKRFIGFVGVMYQTMEAPFTPCYEIGWRLGHQWWNRGLATEGAIRCLEHTFDNFDCHEIFSITPVQNVKSEKIMKKIGMQYHSQFDHPKLRSTSPLLRHNVYFIER